MKRNRLTRPATIGLIGMTAFALAACQEEVVDVPIIRSEAECTALPGASPEDCKAAIAQAEAEHQATAPRYDGAAACEEQHGAGACVADSSSSGGGSIFMPLLTGYLMGSMLSKLGGGATATAASNARSVPLYPSKGGAMATADGSTQVSRGAASASVAPSQAFKSQPVTAGKAPMSSTSVRSTGGFGGSNSGATSGG